MNISFALFVTLSFESKILSSAIEFHKSIHKVAQNDGLQWKEQVLAFFILIECLFRPDNNYFKQDVIYWRIVEVLKGNNK